MKNRNAKGMGSIRQREDGRYEGRITIDGQRKSFYGEKQGEVIKAMRAAKKAVDDGMYFEPSKLSVSKWLDIWLDEYIAHSVKPLTLVSYTSQSNAHIKPELGRIKLSDLNATHIQKLYNDLQRKDGLSAKTIRNTHGVIHKALSKAVELHYIGYNPSDACSLPRVQRKAIQPLEEKDIKEFLRTIEDEPLRDLFAVALFTGIRRGEICGLAWNAIDFEKGVIQIKQQLVTENKKGAEYYIDSTKNSKVRTITPAPFVISTLKDVRRRQNENRLIAGSAWMNDWELVFTNEIGQHLCPQTVLKHFKRIASIIGKPNARFHDLRHTYAVTSLQEGDDIKTVQENLGHATASFTLDVYGHVSEKMKRDSASRMEAYIQNIKS